MKKAVVTAFSVFFLALALSASAFAQELVGAVKHVFVNDPTRGYGICIQDMLAAAEIQAEAASE